MIAFLPVAVTNLARRFGRFSVLLPTQRVPKALATFATTSGSIVLLLFSVLTYCTTAFGADAEKSNIVLFLVNDMHRELGLEVTLTGDVGQPDRWWVKKQ